MSYREQLQIRDAAVLTTALVASDSVDVREIKVGEVDFLVVVGTAGSLTQVDVVPQFSLNGTTWSTIKTESVSSGVSTLYDYTVQETTLTDGTHVPITVPVRGYFMRVGIKGATVTGSSVTAFALRRG